MVSEGSDFIQTLSLTSDAEGLNFGIFSTSLDKISWQTSLGFKSGWFSLVFEMPDCGLLSSITRRVSHEPALRAILFGRATCFVAVSSELDTSPNDELPSLQDVFLLEASDAI